MVLPRADIGAWHISTAARNASLKADLASFWNRDVVVNCQGPASGLPPPSTSRHVQRPRLGGVAGRRLGGPLQAARTELGARIEYAKDTVPHDVGTHDIGEKPIAPPDGGDIGRQRATVELHGLGRPQQAVEAGDDQQVVIRPATRLRFVTQRLEEATFVPFHCGHVERVLSAAEHRASHQIAVVAEILERNPLAVHSVAMWSSTSTGSAASLANSSPSSTSSASAVSSRNRTRATCNRIDPRPDVSISQAGRCTHPLRARDRPS